ncbi:CDP-alcohol phosphatidyltransferase family protein [Oricola sp.]|uniref:CDP-alcohol phosphatidyltransferase family protein n=1 Tax=Oricola sp. TaxID=1979950 RepID=UPI003BAD74F3
MAQTLLTIPNMITVARFIAIPLIVYAALNDQWMTAFVLFVLAGASDAVDGYIARHFDQSSLIGKLMDPLADKALTIAVYTALAIQHQLPMWLVAVIVARDIGILVGAVALTGSGQMAAIRPLFISKVNTALLIVLAAWVLGANALSLPLQPLTAILVAVATISIAASALAYGWLMFDRFRNPDPGVPPGANQSDGTR